jgi:glucose-6-phosphate-specific signal transduction histidine kinase
VLVRVHAVRAWLARRHEEAAFEAGMAGLTLQQAMSNPVEETRPRRRAPQSLDTTLAQQQLSDARQRIDAFDGAQRLLEDCIAHTNGERVLVEYYLAVEQLIIDNGYALSGEAPIQHTPGLDAMLEVMQRIEHVGTPQED